MPGNYMDNPDGAIGPKWKIDNFTVHDLLDALNLPPNPTTIQVTDTANSMIARMQAQGQMEEARFFEEAKQRIIADFEDDDEYQETSTDNEQEDEHTTLGNWWKHEYPRQGDQNQADKATSRHQKIQFFGNEHQQMNRETLGVNQTYQVPVMQGTINPNQRNLTRRMVYIDSAHRQNILPFAGDDASHPSFNTDFTLDLSEPLTNVLSLKLHSIQIPKTWYTFDHHLGNTCFALTDPSPPHSICTCIQPGKL